MAEPSIWLNEFCLARLGAIGSFVANEDLDKWVMELLIIVRASWALQDTLWAFIKEYSYPDMRIDCSLYFSVFTLPLTQISDRNGQALPNGNGPSNGISTQVLYPTNRNLPPATPQYDRS